MSTLSMTHELIRAVYVH